MDNKDDLTLDDSFFEDDLEDFSSKKESPKSLDLQATYEGNGGNGAPASEESEQPEIAVSETVTEESTPDLDLRATFDQTEEEEEPIETGAVEIVTESGELSDLEEA